MTHNPYRYGDETWKIGDKVKNFTIKRPRIVGTVTNLGPANKGNDFLVYVTWPNAGVSTHLNGRRLTRL